MAPGEFDLGRHEAQIDALDNRVCRVEKTVNAMNTKLDGITIALAERKGERRMIAVFATAAGGIGSFVMTVFFKLWERGQ